MKIMFCIGNMGIGGAERVIANLSNYLIKNNSISIVATNNGLAYELNDSIKHIVLDSDKKNGIITRNIKRIIKLRKIIKEEMPDIIVSFLPEPTYRLMIAKTFIKTKVIISVRNDPNIEYNSLFKKILVKTLYSKAEGFVFQTNDAQKWFSRKIQDKSIVIPNPINETFICEPYKGKREKSIVNVGRLTSQKNQKLLINAFAIVLKKHNNYVLKIYGSGPLEDYLEELIDRLNIKDRVKLMGETNDIKSEIYKSGIFVLSSNYEGMPNALMEAMALGIPCISTDCPIGGPKYLINNNENGLLVKVEDENEMANAICYLIENEDISNKCGEKANEIGKKLSPQKINSIWEKYIYKIEKGE